MISEHKMILSVMVLVIILSTDVSHVVASNTKTVSEIEYASNGKEYVYYEILIDGKTYSLNDELQRYIYELCIEYEIEEYYETILCQLYYESHYDCNAISKSGDYGLAQINKCNHKYLKKKLGITDFLDPKQSSLCNVYLMSSYIQKYGIEKALTCYNTGSPNKHNSYAENVIELVDNNIQIKEEEQSFENCRIFLRESDGDTESPIG